MYDFILHTERRKFNWNSPRRFHSFINTKQSYINTILTFFWVHKICQSQKHANFIRFLPLKQELPAKNRIFIQLYKLPKCHCILSFSQEEVIHPPVIIYNFCIEIYNIACFKEYRLPRSPCSLAMTAGYKFNRRQSRHHFTINGFDFSSFFCLNF